MNYAHSVEWRWNLKRSLKSKSALVVENPLSRAVCVKK